MIYEPTNVNQDKTIEVDVCIIGSGAGGSIAAAKLTGNGKSVLIVEEGSYVTRESFDQNEKVLLPKLYQSRAAQATDDVSIRILQGRCFGGSTTINWMTCLRTPNNVLEEWERDFGLTDYKPPLMQKHFEQVEQRLHVHKITEGEHNPHNRIILDGAKKLGIHAEASSNNSINCIGCGYCGLGCFYDAKQDMRLTYLKDALEHGVNVYCGTKAEKITYNSKNSQEILAKTLGEEYNTLSHILHIKTKRIVVAGGTIATPLLLQKSQLTKSKVLGKYLHLHPVTLAIGRFERNIDPSYGIPQSSFSEEYNNLDGNGYGFWLEVPPVQPIMAGVNIPGMGVVRRKLLQDLRKAGVILVLTRDGADHRSNGEVRWRRGRPSIQYKLRGADKEHLMKGLENALEVLFASGAQEAFTMHNTFVNLTSPSEIPNIRKLKNGPNELGLFSAHPMGTARMGTNPKTSVVKETMEMHHYPGIYIMDASVLPTALGVNPMITILASVSRAYELSNTLEL